MGKLSGIRIVSISSHSKTRKIASKEEAALLHLVLVLIEDQDQIHTKEPTHCARVHLRLLTILRHKSVLLATLIMELAQLKRVMPLAT